jgi:hypothetical protein
MDEFSVKKLILAASLVYRQDDCLRRVHIPAPWGSTKGMYPESNTLLKQPYPVRSAVGLVDSLRFPACGTDRREVLFRMALDPSQSRSIEPDRTAFPGRLVTAGAAAGPDAEGEGTGDGKAPDPLELPAGTYFFAQIREPSGMETLIDMVIEVQREGLWERFSLDDRLYIRRLFEDGQTVIQVFRPAGNPQDS